MKKIALCLLVFSLTSALGQTKITGRVVDGDSNAVPLAHVRLLGLTAQQTSKEGFFEFRMTAQVAQAFYLKSGTDLHVEVEKEGMVMLDPPDGKIRLPHNADTQSPFRIVLVKKGSPLLARSERMLEFVFQKRLHAAIAAENKEAARQLEIATEAARLGLPEAELRMAVDQYKERLRTSTNLNEKGLAALDDANEATEYRLKQQKLTEAETTFREARAKNLTAIAEGRKAEALQPEIDFNLGQTFFTQARYDSAAFYYAKADSAAPGDADKLNMLGRALDELALYDRALTVYQRAFAIDSTTLGRNHPKVAIRLNNIAGVLRAKGDYAGALAKYNEALVIDEGYFGRNHPDVAIDLNNIAGVLESKGDYAGALAKYNEALVIWESAFGRVHPQVATALNNIAGVLESKGDYAGALAKYNEALKIFESGFGRVHPQVATALNNIAGVLRAKGDYAGALAKYNEALVIDEGYFGRNHPNVAIRLNNIAGVLESKGDYAGALEKYNEALVIDEGYFGRNHPNVARELNNIAGVLRAKGDYAGALEKYNEALVLDEGYFGRNHPDVAIDLNNIAGVLESKGDYAGALAKYNEALAIFTEFLGPDHPNTKTVAANRMQAFWESLSEAEQGQLLVRFYLPQLDDSLAQSDRLALLDQIGVAYIKQTKADSALIYLRQALPLAQKLAEQEMLGSILNNLGSAYKLQQDWPQARQWLEQSLSHNRKVQGDSAAVLAYTYFHLAGVAQAQGQTRQSREYAQKSLTLAEQHQLQDLAEQARALLPQAQK